MTEIFHTKELLEFNQKIKNQKLVILYSGLIDIIRRPSETHPLSDMVLEYVTVAFVRAFLNMYGLGIAFNTSVVLGNDSIFTYAMPQLKYTEEESIKSLSRAITKDCDFRFKHMKEASERTIEVFADIYFNNSISKALESVLVFKKGDQNSLKNITDLFLEFSGMYVIIFRNDESEGSRIVLKVHKATK
jgi:hypothetical protein